MNPIQTVESAIARFQPRQAYSMVDAVMLNATLGLFEKARISVAALNVENAENAVPVQFDGSGRPGAGAHLWPCVQDGKIYFYFDRYEIVAVIVKTSKRRLVLMKQNCYVALFLTPISPILTSPAFADYDSALEWVEKRYRRAEEVLPGMLDG